MGGGGWGEKTDGLKQGRMERNERETAEKKKRERWPLVRKQIPSTQTTHTHTRTHTNTHILTHTHIPIHTHMLMYTHTHSCIHMLMRTHTFSQLTHTLIHTN